MADSGRLGNGVTVGIYSTPQATVSLASGVKEVRVGGTNACALRNGGVFCWGDDSSGALGNGGAHGSAADPSAVSGLSTSVTAVAVNHYASSCAIANGAVLCWGDGSFGQLGHGAATVGEESPVAVGGGLDSGVSALSGGGGHFCAIKNGGVFCWGLNDTGQLGDGTTTNRSTPVAVTGLSSGVLSLSLGGASSCGDHVRCWGANLGDGTTTSSATPVSVTNL